MTLPPSDVSLNTASSLPAVAVIGAGPAGLMAAEVIAGAGLPVHVYDAMPSAGRKLLRAGIGGLNLTHAEPLERFELRYGERSAAISSLLRRFGPQQLIEWAGELGIDTFIGSSQRIFPVGKKAAPLLRAWLHCLREAGVQFRMRHRWCGWERSGALRFQTPDGTETIKAKAVVLALGGASWPELGSDGSWTSLLAPAEIPQAPLRPSNCGFHVHWSGHFRERFSRMPIKAVRGRLDAGPWQSGELMVTDHGLEGGLLYALSAAAREQVAKLGGATLRLDLAPERSREQLQARLEAPRGKRSLASHLRVRVGIDGLKAGLLREFAASGQLQSPAALAGLLKALPVPLGKPFPLARAISTAGGVRFEGLTDELMLKRLPGFFCAGEMLDWEAPTGGYLLTACFASGYTAGHGVVNWLAAQRAADTPRQP